MNFDTLLNNNKPHDKRFRDTRFILGHNDHVPQGLTVLHINLAEKLQNFENSLIISDSLVDFVFWPFILIYGKKL